MARMDKVARQAIADYNRNVAGGHFDTEKFCARRGHDHKDFCAAMRQQGAKQGDREHKWYSVKQGKK